MSEQTCYAATTMTSGVYAFPDEAARDLFLRTQGDYGIKLDRSQVDPEIRAQFEEK